MSDEHDRVPEWVVLAVGRLYLEREQMERRVRAAEQMLREVTQPQDADDG